MLDGWTAWTAICPHFHNSPLRASLYSTHSLLFSLFSLKEENGCPGCPACPKTLPLLGFCQVAELSGRRPELSRMVQERADCAGGGRCHRPNLEAPRRTLGAAGSPAVRA